MKKLKKMKRFILFPFKLIAALVMLGLYYICMPGWYFVEWVDRRTW